MKDMQLLTNLEIYSHNMVIIWKKREVITWLNMKAVCIYHKKCCLPTNCGLSRGAIWKFKINGKHVLWKMENHTVTGHGKLVVELVKWVVFAFSCPRNCLCTFSILSFHCFHYDTIKYNLWRYQIHNCSQRIYFNNLIIS